ncbi:MAG: NAD(P)H-hydrate epimerase, partial [Acidimicrobiia bacterium]
MQPILTPDEASSLDAAADVPVGDLMERAGLAVALAVSRLGLGYGHRVTVLAGPGNNGGDGWVAARHLAARGVVVRVLTLADPRSGAAVAAAEAAAASGIPGTPWREPDGWEDLVVDAVFGAGFRGPLPDEVQAWVSARPPLVAVDLPSGLAGRTGE